MQVHLHDQLNIIVYRIGEFFITERETDLRSGSSMQFKSETFQFR